MGQSLHIQGASLGHLARRQDHFAGPGEAPAATSRNLGSLGYPCTAPGSYWPGEQATQHGLPGRGQPVERKVHRERKEYRKGHEGFIRKDKRYMRVQRVSLVK